MMSGLTARMCSTSMQQPLARVREEVGEEDVGGLGQPVEQLTPVVGREVERDAPLASVRLFHDVVDPACTRGHEARADQAALRITRDRMLDLQHIRAPIREHRAGGGHERPRCDLDDLDALQNIAHAPS